MGETSRYITHKIYTRTEKWRPKLRPTNKNFTFPYYLNIEAPLATRTSLDGVVHRCELPGNYPVFTVVMVIYHYVERIYRIIGNPNFLYDIYNHE